MRDSPRAPEIVIGEQPIFRGRLQHSLPPCREHLETGIYFGQRLRLVRPQPLRQAVFGLRIPLILQVLANQWADGTATFQQLCAFLQAPMNILLAH